MRAAADRLARFGQATDNAEKFSRGGVERRLLERFRRRLIAVAAETRPATILDAGCGEGFVTEWLQIGLPAARIAGLDVREEALAQAASRVRADLRTGDVHALPYPDGAFDLVVCTEVLEHLESPPRALAEMARVSRGPVLVTVPHEPFFRAGNLALGRHRRRLGSTPGHRWTWSRRAFLSVVHSVARPDRWFELFPWQAVRAHAFPLGRPVQAANDVASSARRDV